MGFTQTDQSVEESEGSVTVCVSSSGIEELFAVIAVSTVAGTASGEVATQCNFTILL